jgi:predicted membrane protein
MSGEPRGVLRWYPPHWRDRYGDELVTLLADTYGTGAVPLRCRLSLARAGTVERLRQAGLAGAATAPADGVRAGALLVLWAWAVFVVAGAGFAKSAEQWRSALPPHDALLATVGFDSVFVGALAGAAIVAAGAVLCARALAQAVRVPGGWAALRRPALVSAGVTLVALAVFAAALSRAHRFGSGYVEAPAPYQQGNPHMTVLAWLVLAFGLLVSAAIAAWTATLTAAVRRIELTGSLVRSGGLLALALAAVMAVILAGTVLWWATLAARAPWFFDGAPPGAPGALVTPPYLVVGVLMTAGFAMAVIGARRVAACLRRATEPASASAPSRR